MRQYCMSLSPVMFMLGVMCLPVHDEWSMGILAVNAAWLVVELFIAVKQEYNHIVPGHVLVKVSRIIWLFAVALTFLEMYNGSWLFAVPSTLKAASLVISAVSVIIRLTAFLQLGKFFSYDVKIIEGHSLVTGGMYRIVRHPAYTALCALGTLSGIAAGSIIGFVLLSICTVPQILYRIRCEEELLENEFGQAFRDYRDSTYRLIPFLY